MNQQKIHQQKCTLPGVVETTCIFVLWPQTVYEDAQR
jgi:hypothetical protein